MCTHIRSPSSPSLFHSHTLFSDSLSLVLGCSNHKKSRLDKEEFDQSVKWWLTSWMRRRKTEAGNSRVSDTREEVHDLAGTGVVGVERSSFLISTLFDEIRLSSLGRTNVLRMRSIVRSQLSEHESTFGGQAIESNLVGAVRSRVANFGQVPQQQATATPVGVTTHEVIA